MLALAVGASAALATLAPGAGAADRPTVVPGQAKARAEGFSVKIQVAGSFAEGGVALGIVQGVAAADSHDDVGAAEGRAIDYGLVDALNKLPTPACPDIVPLFDPATLPPITRADSDQPDGPTPRPTSVRYAGWPAAGQVAGVQDAVAGPAPTGTGSTRTPFVDGGFLQAYDVVSEARGTVDATGHRDAVATVRAARLDLFGGLVTFIGPRFEARSATGAPGAGSFTWDAVYVLGNLSPPASTPADLAGVRSAVEGLLGFLGLKIDWPLAQVIPDPAPGGGATASERVVVSPMRVRLSNMPIGRDLLAPVLSAFGPQIDQAMDAYLADPCANQSLRLIVDVGRGFLTGTGEVGVSFGGVDVETNDRWVAPAVLFDAPIDVAPAAPVVTPPPLVLGGETTRSAPAVAPVVPVVAAPVVPEVAAPAPVAPVAPKALAARRVSMVPVTSSRSEPGRSGGRAVWVGLGVMVVIGALAVADRRAISRGRRKVVV